MMKAIFASGPTGRRTVLLGLTHENLDRLRADGTKSHIQIDGAALGIPHDIWITAAADEHELMSAIQHAITPDTKLYISDKLKKS